MIAAAAQQRFYIKRSRRKDVVRMGIFNFIYKADSRTQAAIAVPRVITPVRRERDVAEIIRLPLFGPKSEKKASAPLHLPRTQFFPKQFDSMRKYPTS